MGPLQSASIYIISAFFSLYAYLLVIRMLLQLTGANPYNSIVQVIRTLTNPVVKPLQHLIPKISRLDLSLIVTTLLVIILKYTLIALISAGELPPLDSMLIASVIEWINKIIYCFIFAIFLQALLSWIAQPQMLPMLEVFSTLTRPILQPIRRVVPTIGGIDISAIPAIFILQFLNIFITKSLIVIASSLAGIN